MLRDQLIELLTEMMATSPSRDWTVETRFSAPEIAAMRVENQRHIADFAEEIMSLFKETCNETKRYTNCASGT